MIKPIDKYSGMQSTCGRRTLRDLTNIEGWRVRDCEAENARLAGPRKDVGGSDAFLLTAGGADSWACDQGR